MKKYCNCLLLILTVVMAIFLGISKKAEASEDLLITDWLIDAYLLENGDLEITEDITFEFNKEFNGVYRSVMVKNTSGITDISIQEVTNGRTSDYTLATSADNGDAGLYTVDENNERILIKIYSPSEDELKTFKINYLVKNVAVKYKDTGELYYKFIGSENETSIENLIVNIHLPYKATGDQVKVFAHGPLNGSITRISDKHYRLQVQSVPGKTFIEGRVLFPREFITLSNNTINTDKYSSILEEEAAFQNKLAADRAKKEALHRYLNIINSFIIVISIIIYVFVLYKCRRKRAQNIYQSNGQIPEECTPAIASLITNNFWGSNVIFASILELFRKGYIKINSEQEGDDILGSQVFVIFKLKDPDISLLSHERHLMNWLFNIMGYGSYVSTKDIEKYGKKNNAVFLKGYTDWKSKVKADAANKGYFDKSKKTYGGFIIVLSMVHIIFGIFTAVAGNIVALLNFVLGIVLLVYGIMLFDRLSDYGYDQYRIWLSFKKYMKNQYIDFSQRELLEAPDVSLIYALALNVIVKNTKAYQPDADYSINSWIFWYLIFISSNNNSFRKSIDSSFAVASDASSSGGFSGGGGGGAGGGGAGGF